MKVLHINQSDIGGGAGIAGYRLHQGLLARGIDSRLLVGVAKTKSDRVATTPSQSCLDRQIFRFTRRLGLHSVNIVSTCDITHHTFYQNAEVLNLNNLHTGYFGYFNYLALPSFTKSKPTIFTLHDMWSFTGHCAYSYDCQRWQTGCGQCPHLDSDPPVSRDGTHLEWKLKNWVYSRSNLTIVTPSKWLTEQAKQSILSRFAIHHIPYGIDTKAYQPLDSEQCRSLLGIPDNKKVLMFGAESLTNPRKGGDLLWR